jgi:ethanolamine ammonia-lyase small subunit
MLPEARLKKARDSLGGCLTERNLAPERVIQVLSEYYSKNKYLKFPLSGKKLNKHTSIQLKSISVI